MGLKAGWLALFLFVWLIGAFLGSTFDYQSSEGEEGVAYTDGTATFTTGSTTVTGAGTTWVAAMEDGNIKANADGIWTKIKTIDAVNQLTLYSPYTGAGGAGLDYTMAVTPGFVGSGTGGYEYTPSSTLGTLISAFNAVQKNPIVGTVSIVTNGEFWKAAYKIITWQWSFLLNPDGTMAYGLFYWIFCLPFVIMGMLSVFLLAYGIITGNLSW